MSDKRMLEVLLMTVMTIVGAGIPAARAEAPGDTLDMVLAEYGRIHEALAGDRVDGVALAAARIEEVAKGEGGEAYLRLASAASAMIGAELGELRSEFKDLSLAMAGVVEAASSARAELFYCAMEDGYWLQRKGESARRNPYFGKSMLGCGEQVDRFED